METERGKTETERGTLEAGARRLRPPKRGTLETERGKTETERGTLEAGARRLRPPKRGSLETERGKTGTGGRGRVRGAGGIKGVARQRAVSTASPSEARMGRRGSDAALSEGRTARRAGLVNAHRWKEGRKRTATGDALNAAFRLNRENRV